jgi:hypothetical protein
LAGKNEYKESQGVGRLREALEANDWNTDDMDLDDFDAIVDDFGQDDESSLGFGIDPKEMEEDMKGMKEAIYGAGSSMEEEGGDHDEEVEKLQAMMAKMQAVRGMIGLAAFLNTSLLILHRPGRKLTRAREETTGCENSFRNHENYVSLKIYVVDEYTTSIFTI